MHTFAHTASHWQGRLCVIRSRPVHSARVRVPPLHCLSKLSPQATSSVAFRLHSACANHDSVDDNLREPSLEAPAATVSPRRDAIREKIAAAPPLEAYLEQDSPSTSYSPPEIPYVDQTVTSGVGRSVYVESYGCQMNMADSEIVMSILQKSGYSVVDDAHHADVVFLNTCAIRENAESKIWGRLSELKGIKMKRRTTRPLHVGVLGCMAERLKMKLIESDKMIDLVVGPDAYRDLPRLLAQVEEVSYPNIAGQQAINVLLSQDETYADITPVRRATNGVSAFVSIMRGCNNMCTYCIVPFTRGRERSRSAKSIEDEVRMLSNEGFKEIVLLGQNVNSYNDTSEAQSQTELSPASIAEGFSTIYKRPVVGVSFAQLLDRISRVDPNMRIRFTSPHPKDFPDELLTVIRDRPNVCKSIHIPLQSGSSEVLERMRRGYTQEAYRALIDRIRETVPGITLSSDFISGFCGETEEDHTETIKMLEDIQYDFAFMFAYSMREKTPAHRRYSDDVPEQVKKRRLTEVIDTFRRISTERNLKEIGSIHLILIEGPSRKSASDLSGRSDTNKRVIIPQTEVPTSEANQPPRIPKPGDYVVVRVTGSTGIALISEPLLLTTLEDFSRQGVALLSHVSTPVMSATAF